MRVIDERENSYDIDEKPHSINVYSGLYVNEAEDLDDDEIVDDLVDVVRPCLLNIWITKFTLPLVPAGL